MTARAQTFRTPDLELSRPSTRDRPCSEPVVLGLIVLALMSVGILMVFSASRSATAAGDTWFFFKHIIFVPVAIGAMVAGAYFPYRRLNGFWPAVGIILLAVALLGLVLVFGVERNHARRWFELVLGPIRISFQPSEFAKFAVVIFFAWFFGRHPAPSGWFVEYRRLNWLYRMLQGEARSFWRGFVPALLLIGAVCCLIAKEDFGTAALLGGVAVLVCLIAGWRWWFTLFLILPASAGFYWFVWLVDYRRERLEVWWDPWQHFTGKGWHICQSLMGIGSGGLTGVGLGAGIQKLYIPEVTTDFIFAAICEEMGMLGGLLVLGLFGALVWRAVRVVRTAPDRFSFLLASGILLTIGLQAAMNIGVVTGALPAKGISLPFISYGGSGLVLTSFAAGLLIAIARAAAAVSEKVSGTLRLKVPDTFSDPGAPARQGDAVASPAAPPHPLVYMPTRTGPYWAPISDVRAPGGSALVSAGGAGDSPATAGPVRPPVLGAESDPLEQDRVA